jgi:hypothetical protein
MLASEQNSGLTAISKYRGLYFLPINKIRGFNTLLIAIVLLMSFVNSSLADGPPSTAISTKAFIQGDRTFGRYSSLALNNDLPVISHTYQGFEDWKAVLTVCKDIACTTPSEVLKWIGDTSITQDSSLAIGSNNLTVSYILQSIESDELGIRFDRCNSSDCLGNAVGNSSIGIPIDTEGSGFLSLALNKQDLGVVAVSSRIFDTRLTVIVCTNTSCSERSIKEIPNGRVFDTPSLAISREDFPIISGYDFANRDLHLLVCLDKFCSQTAPNLIDDNVAGLGSSLRLSSSDLPRISYYGNDKLKLAICNDILCASKLIQELDAGYDLAETSQQLSREGFSVISYTSSTKAFGFQGYLRVAACNDTNCTNPTLTTIRTERGGKTSSLALSASNVPIISYSTDPSQLWLASCPMCRVPVRNSLENGSFGSLQLTSKGTPVVSYWSSANGSLDIDVCLDELCSQSTSYTVDDSGSVGFLPSMVLSKNDFPVISYWDFGNNDLKLATCKDRTCSNPVFKTIDGLSTDAGAYSSLKLNSNGFAVMSYNVQTSKDLNLAVCNDVNCSNPTIRVVDGQSSDVGWYNSLALNNSGHPVISYQDTTNKNLMLAICDDVLCESKTVLVIDDSTDVGEYTSLALTNEGIPVISYYDKSNKNLIIAVCDTISCDDPTIRVVDGVASRGVDRFVGEGSSLVLTEDGFPIISYNDETVGKHDVKVAVCHDRTCTERTLSTVDQEGQIGEDTSLALRDDGFPVIVYHPGGRIKIAVYQAPSDSVFADGFE